jgi:hypothetical protein
MAYIKHLCHFPITISLFIERNNLLAERRVAFLPRFGVIHSYTLLPLATFVKGCKLCLHYDSEQVIKYKLPDTMNKCVTKESKGKCGRHSRTTSSREIQKSIKANAFPVDVFGLYKPDILLRQVIADFSSSFQKKMLMANVQVVMPLMPDTSSDTVVVLSEDTAKRGWYNLRLNIIIPDIKVKLLKNGRKPSIKKKLTTTKSS